MNVANLELCKELYKLSGWSDTFVRWADYGEDSFTGVFVDDGFHPAAYDAGFLLRKLPTWVDDYRLVMLFRNENTDKLALVGYQKLQDNNGSVEQVSHPTIKWQHGTIEDCLTKLAIELFKQKVLTK